MRELFFPLFSQKQLDFYDPEVYLKENRGVFFRGVDYNRYIHRKYA